MNVDTNSWRIFNIKETGFYNLFAKPIVYKNSLLVVGRSEGKICLATYNLDSKKHLIPLSLVQHRPWLGSSDIP